MKLVLYIDGKEWVEVMVRNKASIQWQAAQMKREHHAAIAGAISWTLILTVKSSLNEKPSRVG